MPLNIVWKAQTHMDEMPPTCFILAIITGMCCIFCMVVSCVRAAELWRSGRRASKTEGAVFVSEQIREATVIIMTPAILSLTSLLALLLLKSALMWRLVAAAFLAVAVKRYFRWMINSLGGRVQANALISKLPPERWWASPPLCCCAFLLSRSPRQFSRTDLEIASFWVVSYTVVAQLRATIALFISLGFPEIKHQPNGFCTHMHADSRSVAQMMTYAHMVCAMSCMTSLNTVFKAVQASFNAGVHTDEVEATGSNSMPGDGSTEGDVPTSLKSMRLNAKKFSVVLIVFGTGILDPLCGMVKIGTKHPVLSAADTMIVNAVGCPVYDNEVMASVITSSMMAVLMVPVCILSAWAYRSGDEAISRVIREIAMTRFIGPNETDASVP